MMLIGKYNVELLNSGKFSIRWIDKKTNRYANFICSNLESILDSAIEGQFIEGHAEKIIMLFHLYATSMLDFLQSEETTFITENDKWYLTEQDFNKVTEFFVKAYNKHHNTNVMFHEVFYILLNFKDSWFDTWHNESPIG